MAKKKTRKRCCACPRRKKAATRRSTRRKKVCANSRVVCPARKYGKKVRHDTQTGRCFVQRKNGTRTYVKKVLKCGRGSKAGRFDSLKRQIGR